MHQGERDSANYIKLCLANQIPHSLSHTTTRIVPYSWVTQRIPWFHFMAKA